jgi:hypothetical protein
MAGKRLQASRRAVAGRIKIAAPVCELRLDEPQFRPAQRRVLGEPVEAVFGFAVCEVVQQQTMPFGEGPRSAPPGSSDGVAGGRGRCARLRVLPALGTQPLLGRQLARLSFPATFASARSLSEDGPAEPVVVLGVTIGDQVDLGHGCTSSHQGARRWTMYPVLPTERKDVALACRRRPRFGSRRGSRCCSVRPLAAGRHPARRRGPRRHWRSRSAALHPRLGR